MNRFKIWQHTITRSANLNVYAYINIAKIFNYNQCHEHNMLQIYGLEWPVVSREAGTCDSINLVAFGLNYLWRSAATKWLPCNSGMWWPSAKTNCHHLRRQNSVYDYIMRKFPVKKSWLHNMLFSFLRAFVIDNEDIKLY